MKKKFAPKTNLPVDDVKNGIFFDNNPLPMWVYDLATYRFLAVNHAAEVHYGYSEAEFLSMTIKDIRPTEDVSRLIENVEHVSEGLDEAGVWRHTKKNGSLIFVEIVSHTMQYEGRDAELVVAMDVTERRRAEWELSESEKRFHRLAENAPDLIYRYEFAPKRGFTYVSPAATAITGYTPEEHYADPDLGFKLVHPLDRPLLEAAARGETAPSQPLVLRWVRKDGSILWTEQRNIPVFNESGEMIALEGIARDVTARKQAEESLRESEEKFKQVFESANVGKSITLPNGRINVNKAFADLLGYGREELANKTWQELTPPEDIESIQAFLAPLLNGEKDSTRFNKRYVHKNGSSVWADVSAVIRRDEERKPLYFITTIVDITERKQAEQSLQESRTQLQGMITSAMDAILAVDEDQRIVIFNPAAEQMFKCPAVEALGSSLERFIPEYFRNAHAEAVRTFGKSHSTRRSMKTPSLALICLRADGEAFPSEVSISQSEFDGQKLFTAIVRDITERKQAEEQIRASEDRYRDLVEHIHDLIGTHDLQGNIISINPAASKLLGMNHETIQKMNLRDLLVPEVRDQFDDYLAAIQKHGQASGLMYVQTANGGRKIWEYDNTLRSDSADGPIVRALARDVTESRQAEASLRLQSAALEATVNSIVITDRKGVIQWANSAYSRLTGYTSDEVLGKNPRILSSGLQDKEFYKTMWDTILSGKAWHGELINRRKDGSLYNDEMTITPLVGENGEITHFIGIKQDITERKKAETEIRQRVRELETVNHISVALRASSNREQALAIMLEETLNVFNTRHGAISLWDEETETLREEVARGWLAAITERPIRAGEGIFGTVFASGETHISDDFASDSLTLPRARPLLPLGWGGLCVPIRTSETILGVLTVAAPSQRVFHHEDIRLLETLAEMAGTALHRMSLNEEVQRHLERLKALRQIDMAISGNFDRRATLQTILTQVISQLGVSAADILMLDSKTLKLYLGAYQGFIKSVDELVFVPIGESFAGKAVAEKRMVSSDLQAVRRSPEFYKLWNREGFSNSHAIPLIAKDRPIGVLEVYQRTPSMPNKEWFNFLEALAGQAAIALENAGLFENLESANAELMQAYDSTIEGWSHAMDLRDKETEGHTQRVTALTLRLAHAMGVSSAEMVHIRRGALLHDIGKMGVPDRILLKPDKLTEEEWEIMRKHPTFALEMLQPIHYLKPALNIPYSHHEKWDGTGYPRGLAGKQIPLEARIFAVVDVWDALTSDRPYRTAWSKEKALQYIREQRGTQFDPAVVDAFLSKIEQG